LSYQGYHFVTVGSFSAPSEYHVAVTGTTASVSPLHKHRTQLAQLTFVNASNWK